jgi:ribonuclease Z
MTLQLTFLGTGSGKPMPHRGVSSFGFFREGELFLFDCGEGTQTQLTRSSFRPGAIEAVFLTHFHGDHVNGLPGLVGSLTLDQRDRPLDIVGPKGLEQWFETLQDLNILWPSFPVRLHEIEEPGVVYEHDDFEVVSHPLDHRVTTWGYALREEERPGRFDVETARRLDVPEGPLFGKLQQGSEVVLDDGRTISPDQVLGPTRPGFRLAYCSDTRPCDAAVELADDADILIHEATYPAGEEALAHRRGHSTAVDAARCARKAGAHRLVMTHISQRYTQLEQMAEEVSDIFPETSVARDLRTIELERREASD